MNASREVDAELASRPANRSGQGPRARNTAHHVTRSCRIPDSAHLPWKPKFAQARRGAWVGRRGMGVSIKAQAYRLMSHRERTAIVLPFDHKCGIENWPRS